MHRRAQACMNVRPPRRGGTQGEGGIESSADVGR